MRNRRENDRFHQENNTDYMLFTEFQWILQETDSIDDKAFVKFFQIFYLNPFIQNMFFKEPSVIKQNLYLQSTSKLIGFFHFSDDQIIVRLQKRLLSFYMKRIEEKITNKLMKLSETGWIQHSIVYHRIDAVPNPYSRIRSLFERTSISSHSCTKASSNES